jgi:hypothetical protein
MVVAKQIVGNVVITIVTSEKGKEGNVFLPIPEWRE